MASETQDPERLDPTESDDTQPSVPRYIVKYAALSLAPLIVHLLIGQRGRWLCPFSEFELCFGWYLIGLLVVAGAVRVINRPRQKADVDPLAKPQTLEARVIGNVVTIVALLGVVFVITYQLRKRLYRDEAILQFWIGLMCLALAASGRLISRDSNWAVFWFLLLLVTVLGSCLFPAIARF